jgi:alpha-L-rhamnosidase
MDLCEKAAFLFRLCGREDQAAFCQGQADRYSSTIRKHLIDWDSYTAVGCDSPHTGSQTSQAMAIYYNIFAEEEKPAAFRVLLEKIREEKEHLDTGVLGARVLFFVLSQFGYTDLAHKIMVDPTYPSYGHWVARGETALCEDFNRYDQRISSLNHHFWGSISAWFIQCISGIHFNPNADDIHRADITPHFIESLTHAQAHHDCPNGRIEVEWHRTAENQIDLTLTFPQGMHGNVVLEGQWADSRTRQSVIPAESRTYHLIKL